MKNSITTLMVMLIIGTAQGQNIEGNWFGVLKVQGTQLRMVVHISKTENGYSSTLDSPDQGAIGIPVGQTVVNGLQLKLLLANIGAEYNGALIGDSIAGIFKQGGQEMPLGLSKTKVEKEIPGNSQEAKIVKPYPYYSEDISFRNSIANITLAGTLTLPKKEGIFPVVILISGSGKQNRDEEIGGRKPFLILSDYLTKNGIAVLRYDDRGVAQSTGNFNAATSADFATDVESAIAFLKTRPEINKNKIGLVGHSEGGMIAPMVAAKSKDVSYIVLLAGPGMPCDKLLVLQEELISQASGVSETEIQANKHISSQVYSIIKKSNDSSALNNSLKMQVKEFYKTDSAGKFLGGVPEQKWIAKLVTPWMQYFLKYDPYIFLEKVKCPVLALNGGKDLQVPPKENLSGIEKALKKGGNKSFITKEMAGMNHLFQQCKTGSPTEYFSIEETFSPIALDEISKWILYQTK